MVPRHETPPDPRCPPATTQELIVLRRRRVQMMRTKRAMRARGLALRIVGFLDTPRYLSGAWKNSIAWDIVCVRALVVGRRLYETESGVVPFPALQFMCVFVLPVFYTYRMVFGACYNILCSLAFTINPNTIMLSSVIPL